MLSNNIVIRQITIYSMIVLSNSPATVLFDLVLVLSFIFFLIIKHYKFFIGRVVRSLMNKQLIKLNILWSVS